LQFSDTTNKKGIVQDIDFLVGTDSTSYPLADKARNVNQWYYKVIGWILESSGTWEWDDSNYTDFPIATATLVDGQEDYTLPHAAASSSNASTFLKLIGISVKNSGGNWKKLRNIDESQLPNQDLEELFKTAGLPRFYKVIGNSVKLLPAPDSNNVTLSSGLKVYFQRTMDEFTASDTTQEPGFPRTFHRILSLGGAYDYAVAKGLKNVNSLRAEIEQLKQQLQEYYGHINKDIKIRIMPREIRKHLI